MNKKTIIVFALLILICGISFFAIQFVSNNKYNKQLPELPELSSSNTALKEQIESADKKARKKASGENMGKLGMVYYSSNDYERAAKCFELAATKTPDQWEWSYYKAYLHMELGESEEAAKNMKQVTEVAPHVALAWYRLGEIYQQMNSTKAAEEALIRVSKFKIEETQVKNSLRSTYYPLQVYAQFLLGKIYMSTNKNKLAESELLKIRNKYLNFGPAFRQLGILYTEQGDSEKGKRYIDRANDLNVYSPPVDTLIDRLSLMSKSETYLLKHLDNATYGADTRWTYEIINRALKQIPNNKYIISKAVRQYPLMGLGKQALPLLDQHFNLFKEDYNEMLQVGIRLADTGFRKEAVRYFNQALTFTDKTAEQNATLAGMFFEKLGQKEKAVLEMTKVLEQNSKNIIILGDAVFLFLQTENMDLAKSYFSELKKLDSKNTNVKIFKAILADNKGNQTKATALLEQAFKSDPKNRYCINQLTDIYYKEEKWAEAIDLFSLALEAYPNDSELQMQLGLMLVTCPNESLRNLSAGKEYSERAFYNSRYTTDNRISAGRTLAIAFYQMRNVESAKFYINETIKLASQANAPSGYIQSLRNLAQEFSTANE